MIRGIALMVILVAITVGQAIDISNKTESRAVRQVMKWRQGCQGKREPEKNVRTRRVGMAKKTKVIIRLSDQFGFPTSLVFEMGSIEYGCLDPDTRQYDFYKAQALDDYKIGSEFIGYCADNSGKRHRATYVVKYLITDSSRHSDDCAKGCDKLKSCQYTTSSEIRPQCSVIPYDTCTGTSDWKLSVPGQSSTCYELEYGPKMRFKGNECQFLANKNPQFKFKNVLGVTEDTSRDTVDCEVFFEVYTSSDQLYHRDLAFLPKEASELILYFISYDTNWANHKFSYEAERSFEPVPLGLNITLVENPKTLPPLIFSRTNYSGHVWKTMKIRNIPNIQGPGTLIGLMCTATIYGINYITFYYLTVYDETLVEARAELVDFTIMYDNNTRHRTDISKQCQKGLFDRVCCSFSFGFAEPEGYEWSDATGHLKPDGLNSLFEGCLNIEKWKNTQKEVALTCTTKLRSISPFTQNRRDTDMKKSFSFKLKPGFKPNTEDFWNLDTIGVKDCPYVDDDVKAQEAFDRTITFEGSRYYVSWPWKDEACDLPHNYALAFGRLKSLLRRLSNERDLAKKYDDIIQNQLKKGIIEEVPVDNRNSARIHYIPHHAVVTPQKTTTKVRIVYDASSKTRPGVKSLNECLLRGPVILEDLCGLIIRFRLPMFAIVADIEKAFLQVGLRNEERDVTRFLWLRDFRKPLTDENLVKYRFQRYPLA